MIAKRFTLMLLILAAALLVACSSDPGKYVADEERRAGVIDALVADPSMRQELIERLMSSPAEQSALFAAILKDENVSGRLVQQMIADDRGKALVASRVAADATVARTFMRMLMLTGAIGELMTQQQAELLGLGDVLAHGNQKRTMTDLKRLAGIVDGWAVNQAGRFPVCTGYEDVGECLTRRLPAGSMGDLRLKDAWGRPFQYHSDPEGTRYALISYATDGHYDQLGRAGPTDSHDCDIVFSNGKFIQWPGRIHRNSIR